MDLAILLPLTARRMANPQQEAAVCAATNTWLAETWLSRYNAHGRFRGSVRISPLDPEQAVREIERWAGHPYFVQVAVPMQAHRPYGQRCHLPIWEAAARHNLPVAVHADGGAGVDFWPTPVGYVSHFIEYSTFYPLNFAYHLASLIIEGTFERLENLRFVFADGAYELLAPVSWRLDHYWRPAHYEMPWTKRTPTAYLRDHVRFCAHRLGWPRDLAMLTQTLDVGDAAHTLLFASNYPFWDFFDPRQALAGIPDALRRRILVENARELYGLPAARA